MTDESTNALARLSEVAAPSTPAGPHLSAQELEAVRRGDDDDASLDAAFRHLATCPACRARLSEPAAEVRALVERAHQDQRHDSERAQPANRPPLELVPRRSPGESRRARSTGWLMACAVAAAVLLMWTLSSQRADEQEVALVQRQYVGVMGDGEPSAAVDAQDQNLELKLSGTQAQAARLLLVDDHGTMVAPVMTLRAGSDGLRAVVAPRTFRAPRGAVHAFILFGKPDAVAETFTHLAGLVKQQGAASLDGVRAEIRMAAAKSGARVASDKLRTD